MTGMLLLLLLLLFLTFSVLVVNPEKLLYTVANPARGLLNREKRTKKKSGSAPPPPPPNYRHTYSQTYSKSMDQPGKVANPARGQLNGENCYFPVLVRA